MLFLVDKYIPYIQGVLEAFGDVRYLDSADFTAESVRDADALIIRTRTRCDEALLGGSRVQFIATATIGYDHIDVDYCRRAGIAWQNAPGCNADGVREYVESVLKYLQIQPQGKTLGVVGCGHVGSLVAAMGERLGYRVLRCDPPLGFPSTLQEVAAESDIITFHTPLTRGGKYPSYHLCDEALLKSMRHCKLIINAARGGVLDEKAWLSMPPKERPELVLDCWEEEPLISQEILSTVRLGTFHIAGYSIQGKANATTMAVQAVSRHFALGIDTWKAPLPERPSDAGIFRLNEDFVTLQQASDQFEKLRSNYRLRWVDPVI